MLPLSPLSLSLSSILLSLSSFISSSVFLLLSINLFGSEEPRRMSQRQFLCFPSEISEHLYSSPRRGYLEMNCRNFQHSYFDIQPYVYSAMQGKSLLANILSLSSLLWWPTQFYLRGGGMRDELAKKQGTVIPVYSWHTLSKRTQNTKNCEGSHSVRLFK